MGSVGSVVTKSQKALIGISFCLLFFLLTLHICVINAVNLAAQDGIQISILNKAGWPLGRCYQRRVIWIQFLDRLWSVVKLSFVNLPSPTRSILTRSLQPTKATYPKACAILPYLCQQSNQPHAPELLHPLVLSATRRDPRTASSSLLVDLVSNAIIQTIVIQP